MTYPVIIILGPTATGKSDLAYELARCCNGEIINADSGQFYEPIVIGTAMPQWKNSDIPHHLFGFMNKPDRVNVREWYDRSSKIILDCATRGKLPIIVGGSGFYLSTLFFPPALPTAVSQILSERFLRTIESVESELSRYQILHLFDPERAAEIHSNDRYRIDRAIEILGQGMLPSRCKPKYLSQFHGFIFSIDRPDDQLRDRIYERIVTMQSLGWAEEISNLSAEWQQFVIDRGFVGYRAMAEGPNGATSIIFNETMSYVKRQRTYFRGFKKRLDTEREKNNLVPSWHDYSLTSVDHGVYLDEIISLIRHL